MRQMEDLTNGIGIFCVGIIDYLPGSIHCGRFCKQGVGMKQRPSKQERMMDLVLTILTVIVFAITIYYEVQYLR